MGRNKPKGPRKSMMWTWVSQFPGFQLKLFLSPQPRHSQMGPISQRQTKMSAVANVVLHWSG